METIRRQTVIRIGLALLLLLAAFVAGFIVRGSKPPMEDTKSEIRNPKSKTLLWTCSMHPQIKLSKPGKCPICGMDLIPLAPSGGESGGLREVSVSKDAAQLMKIETAPVERRFVTAKVRMVGKVDFDETRVSYITAWVPGRLDRLFVDYTGVPVKKGDHMVSLYSPELLSAQEELIQAIHAANGLDKNDTSIVSEMTRATVDAAREKLRLWGLAPAQIEAVEQRDKADDHVTIYAPAGGIVIHKDAQEGMYVTTGTRIYTIADLSRVWVNLDAYESDLQWVRYGEQVSFTTEAYPGKTFAGTISFIHPVLNEPTRTVRVRVNVMNESGQLKPGMFVRAVVQAEVATGGRIMNLDLAGKWISPMHPEIVKDGPGTCDICGMPLVRAESLGYVGTAPKDEDKPVVIPVTAPLLTGKRAIVYVQVPDKDKPTFEGREIVLGPRADDYYLVKRGLAVGERVVTKGNFKLDAELQLRAKPSMMTPQGGGGGGMAGMDHGEPAKQTGEQPMPGMSNSLPVNAPTQLHDDHAAPQTPATNPKFHKQLSAVIERYMDIQSALAEDDANKAAEAARKGLEALSAVDLSLVSGQDHMDWMKFEGELKPLLSGLVAAKDIAGARERFALVSEELFALATRFKPLSTKLYQLHCPMAFDNRGANWLQEDEETRNPYFGSAMLKCGDVVEIIPASADEEGNGHD